MYFKPKNNTNHDENKRKNFVKKKLKNMLIKFPFSVKIIDHKIFDRK